jgi:hypothetical protein
MAEEARELGGGRRAAYALLCRSCQKLERLADEMEKASSPYYNEIARCAKNGIRCWRGTAVARLDATTAFPQTRPPTNSLHREPHG